MINISRNIIHDFISERACKKFIKTPYSGLSDKQVSSIYVDYLKHKSKKENFLFTKNTVERILKMDISKVEPNSLSFLGQKYCNEFSFCFLERENISFCYSIDFNSIKIIAFNGTRSSIMVHAKSGFTKQEENFSGLAKAIIGSAVINFHLDEPAIIPNNAIYYVDKLDDIDNVPTDFRNDLAKATKNVDFVAALKKDYLAKYDILFLAIKSFIFLKTASVIDKTFISENKNQPKDKYGFTKKNIDVTVINSFYDQSINVLNPFSVSGHFRNQPKKDGIEVIYIDSFMKKGYKRPAKILVQDKKIIS
jgi:hypothetical protein